MSFLRGSLNYVWCTTSMLGKGATGAVYQGVNKHNGEPVAVKTFNQLSHMRPQEVQMREFEVLKKVKHENIVKLLAIEDDQEGRGKVIVMELCTGGSLFNILDDPENTYGLSEIEFLLVLEHLSAGMRHLRDNNLVHRDLKPGNIMKFMSEEGQTIYKLTDFGAARELQDNQPFASLYGTEEYLHPDMYERAVLRKSVTRSFTANVDLWSIGVTLYHVATGNLPFRPFGGRKNKETMHLITTKKAQGVIAGTQLTENGPIEWARQLPAHCQLSAGLKCLIIPLLAGLLEDNQARMWSFDRFFAEVTNVLSKRVLHVFYMNRVSRIEVFLEMDNTLFNLKEHIQQQTDVSPENQLLLLNGEFFETKVGANTTVRGYPETTVENSITLYCIENNNVALSPELELPKFPVFPSAVSVENDASLAKVGSSVGHEIKRRIETYSMKDFLVKQGIDQFTNMLKAILTKLLHKVEYLKELSVTVVDLADIIEAVSMKQDEYYTESKLILKEVIKLKMDFDKVVDPVRQLHEKSVTDEMLTREWQNATRNIRCPCRNRANAKAKTAVERLRDSWQHLLRDRATRSLTYNDEQFHALEKIKIAETGKRLKALLVEDVKPAIDMIAESVADWYKMGQANFVQAQILEKDVANFENNLYEIKETLSRIKNDLKTDINNRRKVNLMTSKDNCVTNGTSKIDLTTIFALQTELQTLLSQNTELIDNLRQVNLGGEDTLISIDHHGRM